MTRIQPVDPATAEPEVSDLLSSVKKQMGMVPNLISTMAHSPVVAKAYLAISDQLAAGKLSRRLREQLSLVVGETNSCDYCVSAHTVLGKAAGLSEEETFEARQAKSVDAKEQAGLEFARKVVQLQGAISDADLETVRRAGFEDGEIGELVAHVAMNIFSNYFNHVAQTEIDFPLAPSLVAAS